MYNYTLKKHLTYTIFIQPFTFTYRTIQNCLHYLTRQGILSSAALAALSASMTSASLPHIIKRP